MINVGKIANRHSWAEVHADLEKHLVFGVWISSVIETFGHINLFRCFIFGRESGILGWNISDKSEWYWNWSCFSLRNGLSFCQITPALSVSQNIEYLVLIFSLLFKIGWTFKIWACLNHMNLILTLHCDHMPQMLRFLVFFLLDVHIHSFIAYFHSFWCSFICYEWFSIRTSYVSDTWLWSFRIY